MLAYYPDRSSLILEVKGQRQGHQGQMSFTHPSRKSWALIRRLGAAQQSPETTHPPVGANAVDAHLIQVGQAPRNKKFERQICTQKAYPYATGG